MSRKKSQRLRLGGPVPSGGLHVDRLVAHLRLRLGGTHLDAHAASGAVIGRHLDRHPVIRRDPSSGSPSSGIRRARRSSAAGSKTFIRIVAWGQTMAHLPQSMQMSGSQIGMLDRDRPFLELRRRSDEASVGWQGRNGQQVAVPGQHGGRHPLDEVRWRVDGVLRSGSIDLGPCGHVDPGQFGERPVDGGEVALHEVTAATAVAPFDRLLDPLDGLIGGHDVRRDGRSTAA